MTVFEQAEHKVKHLRDSFSSIHVKALDVQKLSDQCKVLRDVNNLKAEVEEYLKVINKEKARLANEVIPERMENEGMDQVRVPDVGTFYPLVKFSASIKDREVGMQWLRDQGSESLIKETVHAGSLAAMLKDRFLNQGLEAPDCFNFSSYVTTGVRKAK